MQRRIWIDPDAATDLDIRQCALQVTARDLALMAATLAHGGRQPCSGEQVVDPVICQHVLAVMVTAGLYETSSDWLYDTGLPARSGVSGGMITVCPGKGAWPPIRHPSMRRATACAANSPPASSQSGSASICSPPGR